MTCSTRSRGGTSPSSARSRSPHYRELYDRLLRVLDFIETERDLLTSLLEANLAEISNDLNDVMKKVTSWGAILVSATLIAGIYGMNFREMPELKWSLGYPFALGSMVLVMGDPLRRVQAQEVALSHPFPEQHLRARRGYTGSLCSGATSRRLATTRLSRHPTSRSAMATSATMLASMTTCRGGNCSA